MKKLFGHLLLAVGFVVLAFSWAPLFAAMYVNLMNPTISAIEPGANMWDISWEFWQGSYLWMTCTAVAMILGAAILLAIFRKEDGQVGAMPAVLLSSGVMLETVAFLQVWSAAVASAGMAHWIDWIVSSHSYVNNFASSTLNGVTSDFWYDYVVTPTASPWNHLGAAYGDQLWLVILGLVMIIVGIFTAVKGSKPAQPEEIVPPEPEVAAEEETEEVEIYEERVITLYCTVMDIRGDYALVKYDDTGIESEVAIALLPFGIDVGDKLKYENYEFDRV